MRKILLTAVLINGAALALLVAACRAPDGAETARNGANTAATPLAVSSAPAPPPKQESPANVVRRVTPAELKGMLDRGEAAVVDVRSKEDYNNGHIKGAISFPRAEAVARASELPKDKLLVFYCA